MGGLKGDYDTSQSPDHLAVLNVEAPVFPFSGNTQFNIFAKVFVLQSDVMCHDTCYYADNAGKLHKYSTDYQFVKTLEFSGGCNDNQSLIGVDDDCRGYRQYVAGKKCE